MAPAIVLVLAIFGAQLIGAAGTRPFAPDGVVFLTWLIPQPYQPPVSSGRQLAAIVTVVLFGYFAAEMARECGARATAIIPDQACTPSNVSVEIPPRLPISPGPAR